MHKKSWHIEFLIYLTLYVICWASLRLTKMCVVSFIQVLDVIPMNGTMGQPNMPNIDVRLELLLKFNCDVLNIMTPWGGISIHGSSLFSGYYKHEDLIKEVLIDGWFHIGNQNPMFLFFMKDKSFQVPLKECFLG